MIKPHLKKERTSLPPKLSVVAESHAPKELVWAKTTVVDKNKTKLHILYLSVEDLFRLVKGLEFTVEKYFMVKTFLL